MLTFRLILTLLTLTAVQPDTPRIVVSIDGDLVVITADGTLDATLVANGCTNAARWTDGAQLIFHASCESHGLYALDLASGEITFLVPADGVVSPDGTMLAELRPDVDTSVGPFGGYFNILVWALDTGESRTIARGFHIDYFDTHVGWLHDTHAIDYETQPNGMTTEIHRVDVASGSEETLDLFPIRGPGSPPPPALVLVYHDMLSRKDRVVWSPDMRYAAYTTASSYDEFVRLPVRGVFLFENMAAALWAVHPSHETGMMPAWSPDGRLAYVSRVFRSTAYTLDDPYSEHDNGIVVQRPLSDEFQLHVVDDMGNRVIFTTDDWLQWPLWLP